MSEEPERRTTFGIDEAEEFGAFLIILPSAIGFEAEKFANAEGGFAATEILGRDVIALEILLRDVNAAEGVVVVNVANDVGELEGEAELFGEVDGAGHAVAIFAEAIESRVVADGKVHLGAGDQVVQVARGHFVAAHGIDERGKDFGGARRPRFLKWRDSISVEALIQARDL